MVTRDKLRDWLEIVGVFSIVASLVFVGLQVKQTQDIAIAAQYQERAKIQLDYLRTMMEVDYSSSTFVADYPFTADWTNRSDLNFAVNVVLYSWFVWDNLHFQYTAGLNPPDHWAGIAQAIQSLYQNCDARWIWSRHFKSGARRSFIEYVESLDDPCSTEDDEFPWRRADATSGVAPSDDTN